MSRSLPSITSQGLSVVDVLSNIASLCLVYSSFAWTSTVLSFHCLRGLDHALGLFLINREPELDHMQTIFLQHPFQQYDLLKEKLYSF